MTLSAFADDRELVEKLSVIGQKGNLTTHSTSSHVLSEKELKKFEFNDIHRVLSKIPGVQIQEEDGFGLRPNIGLRGVHPHRSKKITLMEDGVLIAPAPYAAPAAYYFPQLDKIESIEVFKGASATRFGPSSIGGALNLVTKTNGPGLELGVRRGNYGFAKYDLSAGFDFIGDMSFDYTHLETSGFKERTPAGNTGFVRDNFTFRWDRYFPGLNQSLAFKFNVSSEKSNETYTGLSREDFNLNPLRRYVATELDQMTWTHRQFLLTHSFDPLDHFHVRSSLYHHELDRSWFKFNGFFNNGVDPAVSLRSVLRNSQWASNNYLFRVLKGEADSGTLSNNRDVLDLGDNQRQYLSQGFQMNMDYDVSTQRLDQLFSLGYRYHQDEVNRFHESSYYNVRSGSLSVHPSLRKQTTILNQSEAKAHTLTAVYEALWEKLSLNLVARYEDIDYRQTNFFIQKEEQSKDSLFVPGFGVFYQALESLELLFGMSKGFTPRGPGQASNVKPEEAIQYEGGIRYGGWFDLELISFLSDYKNISGTCTQSGGCMDDNLDQVFNGGRASVFGVEFLLSRDIKIKNLNIPIQFTGTFTQAKFKNSFQSGLTDWGLGFVSKGDPIPYLPQWRLHLALGLEWESFFAYLNANYRTEMADQAVALGQDSVNREFIEKRFVADLSMGYRISKWAEIRFRVDNLADQRYIVSQRPFGLRPGRPRTFFIGAKFAFR